MTKLELKQHTKELYESVIDLLQTKENIDIEKEYKIILNNF